MIGVHSEGSAPRARPQSEILRPPGRCLHRHYGHCTRWRCGCDCPNPDPQIEGEGIA